MKISRDTFLQGPVDDERPRVGSKQYDLSLSKCPFSLVLRLFEGPALRLLEGKVAALFARRADWSYVSTEQWRERR